MSSAGETDLTSTRGTASPSTSSPNASPRVNMHRHWRAVSQNRDGSRPNAHHHSQSDPFPSTAVTAPASAAEATEDVNIVAGALLEMSRGSSSTGDGARGRKRSPKSTLSRDKLNLRIDSATSVSTDGATQEDTRSAPHDMSAFRGPPLGSPIIICADEDVSNAFPTHMSSMPSHSGSASPSKRKFIDTPELVSDSSPSKRGRSRGSSFSHSSRGSSPFARAAVARRGRPYSGDYGGTGRGTTPRTPSYEPTLFTRGDGKSYSPAPHGFGPAPQTPGSATFTPGSMGLGRLDLESPGQPPGDVHSGNDSAGYDDAPSGLDVLREAASYVETLPRIQLEGAPDAPDELTEDLPSVESFRNEELNEGSDVASVREAESAAASVSEGSALFLPSTHVAATNSDHNHDSELGTDSDEEVDELVDDHMQAGPSRPTQPSHQSQNPGTTGQPAAHHAGPSRWSIAGGKRNTRYRCKAAGCSEAFARSKERKAHYASAHPDEPAPAFTCVICGKTMSRKDTLKNHRRKFHRLEDDVAP